MGSREPPLLRVHWPDRLPVADPDAAALRLVGCCSNGGVSELVVTGTTSGGTATAGAAVGTLLLRQGQAAHAAPGSALPTFVLRATDAPGGQLPILLQPGSPQDAEPGHRRRSARFQQQQQQQPAGHPRQQDWQCQFILHRSTQGLARSCACSHSSVPGSGPGSRQQVASQLAVHMIGALLALLLLAHRQTAIDAVSLGDSALATFATRQLLWLMTAQPGGERFKGARCWVTLAFACLLARPALRTAAAGCAMPCHANARGCARVCTMTNLLSSPAPCAAGVKLHRQLCELLSVAGLQYVASVRWALSGRAGLLGTGATGGVGCGLDGVAAA